MDFYMAQVVLFAGNYPPRGWLACNGQILPINTNEALFSLLGNQFGGDGTTNFGLPNLPAPGGSVNAIPGYYICVEGVYPSRWDS